MLGDLAEKISSTGLSFWFRNELWVIPVSQSIHIFCIAVVFASAAMISFRLLGVGRSGRSVSKLVDTLVPWMYRALTVLLLTGLVQTVAEPKRQFSATAFWAKMVMVLLVTVMTVVFAKAVRRGAARWDSSATRPVSGRAFAVISLMLWVGIIVCGRFIAYTYTDFL